MDISAAELKEVLSHLNDLCIVDVREELEFYTFNIGGENIPLGRLPGAIEDWDIEKTSEVVVICQHGIRSETARRILSAAGYQNVKNLKGGLLAYRKLMM